MSETKSYSMKEIFDFWRKCERSYSLIKKIFWIFVILNLIFWAVFIPFIDENITPLIGFTIFVTFISTGMVLRDKHKETTAPFFFLIGILFFIYSYFVVFPLDEMSCSFVTNKKEKLIEYGKYQFFHIPLYHKHFNYNIYQQRSFVNTKNNSEITVIFKFDFDELIKNTLKNGEEIFVSKNWFNKMVDQKMKLSEVFIKQFGLSKELLKDSILNENWLKITSLKIEYKSVVIE